MSTERIDHASCEWHAHSIFGPCPNGFGIREHLFGNPHATAIDAIRERLDDKRRARKYWASVQFTPEAIAEAKKIATRNQGAAS